jgi:hypothetical protein
VNYILTCNNRPIKTTQHFSNCIIHELTDGKGLAHHRNVVMNEARSRGEKSLWMLDDDIEHAYKKGSLTISKKTGKQYPSKEETIINLDDIKFPEGTAVGGLSKGIFPFNNKSGFSDVSTSCAQVIWINLELFGNWNQPEEPVGEVADDGELAAYAFFKGWGVKKSLDYSYVCNNSITTFNGKRIALWYSIMETYKKYNGSGFGSDPRLIKAWKEMLNQGPWQDPNGKNSKNIYKSELIKRGLWI